MGPHLPATRALLVRSFFLLTIVACRKPESVSKIQQYKWNDNTCSYIGSYKATDFSEDEITGAHALLTHVWMFRDFPRIEGDTIPDVQKHLNDLEAEQARHKKTYESLQIPDMQIWRDFRATKLREIEALFRVEYFAAKALSSPDVLDSFGTHDSCLDFHARAMKRGGSTLLDHWKVLTRNRADQNGDPDRIWNEFHGKNKSSRRLDYAKVDVMQFGWRNCALATVPHLETIDSHGDGAKEFKKLFTDLESSCSHE